MSGSIRARTARWLKRRFDDWLGASPATAAKLRPLERRSGTFVISAAGGSDSLPPQSLWEGYAHNAAGYLESGRQDARVMIDALAAQGVAIGPRVLDFGCAAGRTLRHLPRADDAEHWGVDISAPHILWCQQHLADCNFATVTTAPHLPFEDGYFDLVYAASVFTHISELADAWLLELRRTLRSGGIAYLTVHDLVSHELLLGPYSNDPLFAGVSRAACDFEATHRIAGSKPAMFAFGADPESQVFYDPSHLRAKWGRWMEVLAYLPQAHQHQSAIILRKR